MDISFVILNYKSKGLLKNCLKSIISSDLGGLRYEIIVVDNASNDGVAEMASGRRTANTLPFSIPTRW